MKLQHEIDKMAYLVIVNKFCFMCLSTHDFLFRENGFWNGKVFLVMWQTCLADGYSLEELVKFTLI